jgi:hypothetical protein
MAEGLFDLLAKGVLSVNQARPTRFPKQTLLTPNSSPDGCRVRSCLSLDTSAMPGLRLTAELERTASPKRGSSHPCSRVL